MRAGMDGGCEIHARIDAGMEDGCESHACRDAGMDIKPCVLGWRVGVKSMHA